MYLDKMSVLNYRNLFDNDIRFSKDTNIFVGKNGQGKTNLLEAIYFLSLSRSFKSNKIVDLIKFDYDGFYLKASIQKSSYKYLIEASYSNDEKRLTINNNVVKFKDMIGLMNTVLFVPEDLQLIKGSPKLRRRLLDIELSKLYPNYLYSLSSYYQILKQRNSLLKTNLSNDLVLDALDQQLASFGETIIEMRLKFIKDLSPIINRIYQSIANKTHLITIEYDSSANTKDKSYLESLKQYLKRDTILQQTSVGIHRDDFKIFIDDKEASIFASQGEQRSLILAIKLALVEYINIISKEYPILLLDDVLSELDEFRQNNLLKFLNNSVQTFITTTSLNSINEMIKDNAKIFTIINGSIKEEFMNGE